MGLPARSPARELTGKELDILREKCAKLEKQLDAMILNGRKAWWRAAKIAYQLHSLRADEVLGYEDLNEWLAEKGMTRRQYFRMVRAWGLVETRAIPPATIEGLEPSKVEIVLPAIEAGRASTEEALDDVQAMGFRDLREEYIPKPPESPSEPVSDEPKPETTPDPPFDVEGLRASEESRGHLDPFDAWMHLYAELREGYLSGSTHPRISRDAIGAGLLGLSLTLADEDDVEPKRLTELFPAVYEESEDG